MEKRAENHFGYWLFYAQRSWAYAFNDVLKDWCQEHEKPYAITPPQLGILLLLQEEEGLTIGTISQKRGLDPPTVTGIVTRLEQATLVKRVHDLQDRRVVKVYLTAEGHNLRDFLPGLVQNFTQIALQGIPMEKQQEICFLLQKMVANLSSIGPDMGDRFSLLPDFFRTDT